jgi:hypothetical protein
VAYLVPSFSTRYVAPVTTKSTFAMPNNTPPVPAGEVPAEQFPP